MAAIEPPKQDQFSPGEAHLRERIRELEEANTQLKWEASVHRQDLLEKRTVISELEAKHTALLEKLEGVIAKLEATAWHARDEWTLADLRAIIEQEKRDV